jgi:hypothetical protein
MFSPANEILMDLESHYIHPGNLIFVLGNLAISYLRVEKIPEKKNIRD